MTDPSKVKTLGIRLPDELHTQFVLVASLDGLSLTDAIRKAVELYVETKRSEGDFAERATAALEEIEREAATRRSAIEGLFGQGAAPVQTAEAPTVADTAERRGRRRSGEPST
jgi:predicted DNA-binding protein